MDDSIGERNSGRWENAASSEEWWKWKRKRSSELYTWWREMEMEMEGVEDVEERERDRRETVKAFFNPAERMERSED